MNYTLALSGLAESLLFFLSFFSLAQHSSTPEQGRCENVWLVVFWLLCGNYLGMLRAWMELGGLLNRCMGVSDEFVRECPWLGNMELKMWSGQYGFGRSERV